MTYSKKGFTAGTVAYDRLSADPASPVPGYTYYRTTDRVLRTYDGSGWHTTTLTSDAPPALTGPLGYGDAYGGGFAAQGAQMVTPTVTARATKVAVKLDAAGTHRVGYTASKPASATVANITWLAYADVTTTGAGAWAEAALNVPMDFTSGTAVWAVSVPNTGPGNIAFGSASVAGTDLLQCTMEAPWYGTEFQSQLATYWLTIQARP